MLGIKDLPPSERPREKMLQSGASTLSSAELLALIISSGTREESAISLASRVISMEGGLRSLSNCQPEEFMRIKGVGKADACRITAAIELGRRMASAPPQRRIKLADPRAVADMFMEEMRHLQQEKLRIVMVNSKGELIAREDVSLGGVYSSFASPREVYANAVRKGAYGVILAHNHPSGDPSPSDADIAITKQIAAAGKLLEIELMDHVIIGDGRFVSLKEQGVI